MNVTKSLPPFVAKGEITHYQTGLNEDSNETVQTLVKLARN
jgi:hypothetical protein